MSYVEQLLAGPLPAGAEIHPYNQAIAPAGYIDDTFEAGDQPYPITAEQAAALLAHGAADCRSVSVASQYPDGYA